MSIRPGTANLSDSFVIGMPAGNIPRSALIFSNRPSLMCRKTGPPSRGGPQSGSMSPATSMMVSWSILAEIKESGGVVPQNLSLDCIGEIVSLSYCFYRIREEAVRVRVVGGEYYRVFAHRVGHGPDHPFVR